MEIVMGAVRREKGRGVGGRREDKAREGGWLK